LVTSPGITYGCPSRVRATIGAGRSPGAARAPPSGGTGPADRRVKASTVSRTQRRTAGGTSPGAAPPGARAPAAGATSSEASAKS
jgi:hypothetical protein